MPNELTWEHTKRDLWRSTDGRYAIVRGVLPEDRPAATTTYTLRVIHPDTARHQPGSLGVFLAERFHLTAAQQVAEHHAHAATHSQHHHHIANSPPASTHAVPTPPPDAERPELAPVERPNGRHPAHRLRRPEVDVLESGAQDLAGVASVLIHHAGPVGWLWTVALLLLAELRDGAGMPAVYITGTAAALLTIADRAWWVTAEISTRLPGPRRRVRGGDPRLPILITADQQLARATARLAAWFRRQCARARPMLRRR